MAVGKKVWVFADGDLPPQGDEEPLGHEALMVLNTSRKDAQLNLSLYFEDKDPVTDVTITIPAQRVTCTRMDYPVGDQQVHIPEGQYALVVESSEPVVAVFGRLDRRQRMAYYPVQGFSQ